ncbi:MAG: gamma-glutamyltransferase [Ferruginibacter sp.]|nr:gamma-glutamyltransferase [Cytophagales bacterium]
MTKSLPLILVAFLAIGSCQPTKRTVSQGKGVYQFLNDDTTRRNLSPFFSDRAGVVADHGMVSSAHPVASRVGVDILEAGGTAIDAAIAVKFALAVVHPSAGNLGGGGFVVYREQSGRAYTLDFREKAPAKAFRDMYLDSTGNVIAGLSFTGHLASGVPGTVAGMVETHRRFGKLAWETLLAPAIQLADRGVRLTAKEAQALNRVKADLERLNPGKNYLIKPTDWLEGDTLVQKDLAKTLGRIRDGKRAGFYAGETARLLTEEMQRGGGLITQPDLDGYQAVWREPITATYKDYKIISMPPPTSGGVALIQLLKMVENYPLARWGWNADSTVMVMIEAERRVYADRAKFLGDPDFVKIPVTELVSKTYLRNRMADFSFAKASESKNISGGRIPGYESSETTHFSVVDRDGNAVAITTTLNGGYGSRVFVGGAGFLLNNEMDDFSAKPGVPNAYGLVGAEANAIQPGKRMLSAMTPTIVEKEGKLYLVVGTPGGSTIITSVFQTILNVLEHGMTMQQAVSALKFHHQWLPDKTIYEQNAFSPATVRFLQERGQVLEELKGTIGRMDAILKRADGKLEGGADPRADDTAVGY